MSLQNNNGSQKISGDALKDLYKSFVAEYPIVSIEDPFDQDDWEHYAKMTTECGDSVQIVGDDLLVTNPKVCDITRWSYQFMSIFLAFSISQSAYISVSLIPEGCKGNRREVLQCSSLEGILQPRL